MNAQKMKKMIWWAAALVCALLPLLSLAEERVYSMPVGLEQLLDRGEPDSESRWQEPVPQAAAYMPVQGQFVKTTEAYGTDGGNGWMFFDATLSGPFTLRIDSEGWVYLDVMDAGIPGVTFLDEDCIAPPHKRTLTCNSLNLSQWGWRTGFEGGSASKSAFSAHMSLGMLDAETGRLVGYSASEHEPGMVYLVYKDAIARYAVTYYDAEGVMVSTGREYLLYGSDATRMPENISFPGEQSKPVAFIVKGTKNQAPSFATGPLHLQAQAEKQFEVSFYVDGVPYGAAQSVSEGGTVDWALAPVVPETEGRIFAGWVLEGEEEVYASARTVFTDLALHARFDTLHPVLFYGMESGGEPLRLWVRHGDAIRAEWLERKPGVNRPFLGWEDAQGNMISQGTPVLSALALYPRFAQLEARALFYAGHTYLDINGNEARHEWMVHAEEGLAYDAEVDSYYVAAAALPRSVQADVLYNEFFFHADPSLWAWGVSPEGAVNAFSAKNGRLYFDGLRWEAIEAGRVYVQYREKIVLHAVALYDQNAAFLSEGIHVLEGGSLKGLAQEKNVQALFPEDTRSLLAGFDVYGEARADYPDAIRKPIRLIARYKQLYPVSFYVNLSDKTPWHVLRVAEGEMANWEQVAAPEVFGKAFEGWRRFDAITGQTFEAPQKDVPVKGPLVFVAHFRDLLVVEFMDAKGNTLYSKALDTGAAVDMNAVTAPVREGLRFSHWEDDTGIILSEVYRLWDSTKVWPVYEATVSFYSNGALYAEKEVREGKTLLDLPDAPHREGYAFIKWDVDLETTKIYADIKVNAIFEADAASKEAVPEDSVDAAGENALLGEESPAEMAYSVSYTRTDGAFVEVSAGKGLYGGLCGNGSEEAFE